MLTGVGGRTRAPAVAVGCAVLFAFVALFTLYLSQSLTSAVNSDGAANVLQGQAMGHGNPLLRGWWTSDVSFYATELPEYAFITAVRGVSPDVVHLCGALTYTLSVLLAAAVAAGSGRPGWYRAGIAAGIMLAPSILGGTEVFLENPDHAGTAVPVLVLLLLLDRIRACRWYTVAAACALLALAQLADPLALVAATVPLAVACAIRLVAAGAGRRPRTRFRRHGFRPDGPLLAAAAASAGLAWLAGAVIRSSGGFDTRPLHAAALVPLGQVPANARALGQSLVLLFGANGPGAPRQPITTARHAPLVLLANLHLVGLVLAVAGFAAGIALVAAGRADRVSQVLVVAIGTTLAAGLFSPVLRSLANAHEVAILLPLAAALAGRVLAPPAGRLASARAPARAPSGGVSRGVSRPWPARLAAAALAGWLAVSLAELCYAAAWPSGPPPMRAVAAWLIAHHEREGLAGYWQADVTTVATGGLVLVAPVGVTATSPDRWESSADWYRPGTDRATFVIAAPGTASGTAAGGEALTVATVRARFGPPAARYLVGGEVIMTYRYNLLTRLRDRAFPGAP